MSEKFDSEEEFTSELIFLNNVTKRQQAEDALRLSEERFSKAFYSSPVAMCVTTVEDCVHRYVNKSWVDMMGYSREEAIGKTTSEMDLWVNPDRGNEFQQEILTKGRTHNFEMHFRRKNGGFGTGLASAEMIIMNNEPCRLITVTDITERKTAEEKLRRSEQEKTNILESITDGFFTFDYQWQVTYWNNAAENMFNVKREEILGKNLMETFPRYFGTEFKNQYRQIINGNQPIFLEILGPYTGQWVEARAYPSSGGIAVYLSNITERKQAEQALRQSEEKFAVAFQCNPDLMSISTLEEGRYVEVNDAFVKITGYERHEAIGRTSSELGIWVIPGQRNYVIKQIQEHGSIRGYEIELRIRSGEIKTFCLSGEIIDINDEPHLLSSSRDISESKRINEALRLSEECFSKAFNASPVPMVICSLEDARYIKVNNAYCTIIGYSHEEMIGRTTSELGIWDDPADHKLVIQKIMGNKTIRDMEIVFVRKTGEQRLGLLSLERININGESATLSMLTDITDLKKMEVELTRLDRLNVVGEMAASIGHEIRNPMTTVRGYLQLLSQKREYFELVEYFNLMIEELDRANSIITEFLSLTKNSMALNPRNLNEIICKSMPLLETTAVSQGQIIKLEIEELPDLLLDEKEIRQLIINMVNNGLESMSSPGELTIRTLMQDGTVVLMFTDQGHGIDRKLLDKLGTPFFTTKEQGTGLGLAVCYRIASRHNAKIDIETSSTGTTFYVRFQNTLTTVGS